MSNGNSEQRQWCSFAGYRVNCWIVRKQVHRFESRMEYYWELRSKNAKNITALMCPLYTQALSAILCRECMNGCNQKPHWNTTVVLNWVHASPGGREPYCSVYTEQSVYTRASNFFVLQPNIKRFFYSTPWWIASQMLIIRVVKTPDYKSLFGPYECTQPAKLTIQ